MMHRPSRRLTGSARTIGQYPEPHHCGQRAPACAPAPVRGDITHDARHSDLQRPYPAADCRPPATRLRKFQRRRRSARRPTGSYIGPGVCADLDTARTTPSIRWARPAQITRRYSPAACRHRTDPYPEPSHAAIKLWGCDRTCGDPARGLRLRSHIGRRRVASADLETRPFAARATHDAPDAVLRVGRDRPAAPTRTLRATPRPARCARREPFTGRHGGIRAQSVRQPQY